MIRQAFSLVLASILIIPATPVSAEDLAAQPTLAERLGNMDAEVEIFLSTKPAGSLLEPEASRTNDSIVAERVRIVLLNVKPDTNIKVMLRDGETVEAPLVDVTGNSFRLAVKRDAGGRVYTQFGFDQVDSLQCSGSDKWIVSESFQEIPTGKRVEVLLLVGEDKVQGRLSEVTETTLSLEKDKGEFPLDEVAGVRKLGMRRTTKALIALGISIPLLVFLGYFFAAAAGA